MSKDLIWAVRDKEVKQVKREKLDFKWKYNSFGQAKMVIKKASSNRPEVWQYVFYGETKEEAIERANAWLNTEIQKLEKQLTILKEGLVK